MISSKLNGAVFSLPSPSSLVFAPSAQLALPLLLDGSFCSWAAAAAAAAAAFFFEGCCGFEDCCGCCCGGGRCC